MYSKNTRTCPQKQSSLWTWRSQSSSEVQRTHDVRLTYWHTNITNVIENYRLSGSCKILNRFTVLRPFRRSFRKQAYFISGTSWTLKSRLCKLWRNGSLPVHLKTTCTVHVGQCWIWNVTTDLDVEQSRGFLCWSKIRALAWSEEITKKELTTRLPVEIPTRNIYRTK
jgi:hypothetical protein